VRFEARAQAVLSRGAWPGNVRELENVIARAVLHASARVAKGDPVVVAAVDLGEDVPPSPSISPKVVTPSASSLDGRPLREAVRDFQREAIRAALLEADGSWAAAARALGLHRSNLHHLAKRLGMR